MKVIGAIALLIAAFLGWVAYCDYSTAAEGRASIKNQGWATWAVSEGLGVNSIGRLQIESLEGTANKLAIGAVVFGLLGLILCCSDSSTPFNVSKAIDVVAEYWWIGGLLIGAYFYKEILRDIHSLFRHFTS
jgi:hypothetical protein